MSYNTDDMLYEEARRLPTVELLDLIVRLAATVDMSTVVPVEESRNPDRMPA